MKTKTSYFLASAVAALMVLFSACAPEGQVYKDFQSTGDNTEWAKSKVPLFTFTIDNASQSYDVVLAVRFAKGFPYTHLKINLKIKSPSGTLTEMPAEIRIRDEKGDYQGEVMGDIGDVEQKIQSGKVFSEKGSWEYSVVSAMPQDPVPMIMEIGLIVKKAE